MEVHHTTECIKQEVVECEFVGDVSQDVHQLCTACLCKTRTTHALSKGALKQYYMHILTEMQPEGGVVLQSPRVCWECAAHLKRSVRFREQVQDSYRQLQPMLLKADNEGLDEFLQSSVCRPGRLKSCFAFSINISPQDDEAQLMTITKQKNDDDDNVNYEVCVSEDVASPQTCNYQNDNIKQEVLDDIKTLNTPISTQESTGNIETTFVCYYCHKSFTSKGVLEHHITTHYKPLSSETCYQCAVCNKSLLHKSSLVKHMRSHTGEKPYQYEVCSKSFGQKSTLVNHIKTQAGEKQNLISHKRSHSREKPFQCEVCPRAFTYKQSLVAHTLTHTGERAFQCQICCKSYRNKCDFISHIEAHTGEKAQEKIKKSSRNMSPEDRNQIIILHQEGRNMTSIAEEMGLTRSTVRLWVRRYQAEGHVRAVRAPQRPFKIRGRRLQEMLAAYQADPATPTRQFAERYGCTTQCVRDALRRAGGVRHNSHGEVSSWELPQRRS